MVSYTPESAVRLLEALVGEWAGSTSTWFEPGVLAGESPARGNFFRHLALYRRNRLSLRCA